LKLTAKPKKETTQKTKWQKQRSARQAEVKAAKWRTWRYGGARLERSQNETASGLLVLAV